MIKWLKTDEERLLEKAKKSKAEQDKIISELESKKLKRQAKQDALDKDYGKRLLNYQNRSEAYLVQMPGFDRFVWFCATVGEHRKKYSNPEWKATVKAAGLEPVEQMINDLCGLGEKPPIKRVLSESELLED